MMMSVQIGGGGKPILDMVPPKTKKSFGGGIPTKIEGITLDKIAQIGRTT